MSWVFNPDVYMFPIFCWEITSTACIKFHTSFLVSFQYYSWWQVVGKNKLRYCWFSEYLCNFILILWGYFITQIWNIEISGFLLLIYATLVWPKFTNTKLSKQQTKHLFNLIGSRNKSVRTFSWNKTFKFGIIGKQIKWVE